MDNHRIQKFSVEGKFLAAVGTRGQWTSAVQLSLKALHSMLSTNKVYIVDSLNHLCSSFEL